ncbi:unannotated protein [freshwater metagenome]|uniref:Unannotated protein n=1 Tax=freshwater metagenome TaxID=449393 RepID=A0A6J6KPT3_9ZZZZ
MRFSLLMMISGAPRSSSRLRRLLRLITRRYRSFRSEVAKRPPSSCTIGRRSGGITGTQSRTIPSGELTTLPFSSRRLNAETTLRRLMERAFFCPFALWLSSLSSISSDSRSRRLMRSLTASAPIPPAKYSPTRYLISRHTRSSSMSCLTFRDLIVSKTVFSKSRSN